MWGGSLLTHNIFSKQTYGEAATASVRRTRAIGMAHTPPKRKEPLHACMRGALFISQGRRDERYSHHLLFFSIPVIGGVL